VIEARSLRRTYPAGGRRRSGADRVALDDFSLSVRFGEIHGLLGPNGAGKTTLVKILATVLTPTAGTASVRGYDVVRQADRVRREIGLVLGGDRGLYTRLSARQNLYFWGAVARLDRGTLRRRADLLLDRLGLAERAGDPVETYSRGMKQRLHLARGLIGDPSVVILDEPTTGMDPVATRDFRGLIGSLRAERKTVLITTHDMAEAEQLCDQVSLIDHGRLLFTESPQRIGRLLTDHGRVDFVADDPRLAAELAGLPGVLAVEPGDGRDAWRVHATRDVLSVVLKILVERGVSELVSEKPTLEQVYLHFVGDRGLKL
jgi:ABC-2 type transport system ATP-binding protein